MAFSNILLWELFSMFVDYHRVIQLAYEESVNT
jgi:hypothetical protein